MPIHEHAHTHHHHHHRHQQQHHTSTPFYLKTKRKHKISVIFVMSCVCVCVCVQKIVDVDSIPNNFIHKRKQLNKKKRNNNHVLLLNEDAQHPVQLKTPLFLPSRNCINETLNGLALEEERFLIITGPYIYLWLFWLVFRYLFNIMCMCVGEWVYKILAWTSSNRFFVGFLLLLKIWCHLFFLHNKRGKSWTSSYLVCFYSCVVNNFKPRKEPWSKIYKFV